MPNIPAGNYYVHVVTDAAGAVYEANEPNNQRATPITVTTPDLVPTALTGPPTATPQQSISVSWTVQNQGTGATVQTTWWDYLYISPNSTCCTGATYVYSWAPPGALAAGASYTQSKSVTLPNVPAGAYYLHIVTDAAGAVFEANEANNQRSTPITIGP